jgi:hypothetical protein
VQHTSSLVERIFKNSTPKRGGKMMKKVLMIGLAVTMIFIGTNAVAEEESNCGSIDVLSINLYESDRATDVPIAPSDVEITFTPENSENTYELAAVAYGTQLSLVLLKALNLAEPLYGCVALEIDNTGTFFIRIANVSAYAEEDCGKKKEQCK